MIKIEAFTAHDSRSCIQDSFPGEKRHKEAYKAPGTCFNVLPQVFRRYSEKVISTLQASIIYPSKQPETQSLASRVKFLTNFIVVAVFDFVFGFAVFFFFWFLCEMYLLKQLRTALFNSLIYFFFREKMSALCAQTPKRLTLLDECYDYYFSHRLTRHMIRITKNIARWWRKLSARGTSNHGVVKVLFFFFSFFCGTCCACPSSIDIKSSTLDSRKKE